MISLDLFRPPGEIRELTLLVELEKNPIISQRELSNKIGIALGITNACLKRMVIEGWIQIRNSPPHRMAYYITPKGFSERDKLMLRMISYTMKHYSQLKKVITKILLNLQEEGVHRLVFYGIGEEMEVAYVTLQGVDIELVGIVEDDDKKPSKTIFGYNVKSVRDVMFLIPDGIFITSSTDAERRLKNLQEILLGHPIKIRRF
jgi:DNA-binding MarR family transcriptional regulator